MTIALASSPTASSPRTEIRALTGLRAVAAIAVVVHHIGLPPSAPEWARTMAQCGFIGVPLFFMLSGFVLAYNYPTLSVRDGRGVVRFWIARIARVMPLYWAVLIWAIVNRELNGTAQDPSLPLQFLAVQTWSGDLLVGAGIYNGPAWSICVEIFLYGLFPFFVVAVAALARRFGVRGLLVLVGAAFAVQLVLWALFVARGWADLPAVDPASAHRWLYRNPLTRVPEFVVGMSLAFLHHAGFRLTTTLAGLAQAAVIALTLVLCAFRDTSNGALGAAFFGTLWTVPFALLICSLAADRAFFARFLSTRALLRLGAASYALYITHRGLLPAFGVEHVRDAPGRWEYAAVLVVLALSLAIAEGAHRYIEVPCRAGIVKLADRVLPRRTERRADVAVDEPAPAGPLTPVDPSGTGSAQRASSMQ